MGRAQGKRHREIAVTQGQNYNWQKRTIHRRFRFPKEIDEDAINAEYTNGVLEVVLPVAEDAKIPGKTIPVEG